MKGSWRYLRSGYGSRNADFDIVNEAGGRVASTPYEDKARLIAAAPELLNVLRDAVEEMNAWMLERTPTADDIDAMRSAFRAAIAKVEQK